MRRSLWMAALALSTAGVTQAQTAVTCHANFTLSQAYLQANVHNTSTSTPALPGTAYSYGYINFGDGTSPSGTMPGYSTTHNYLSPGTYSIWLSNTTVDSLTSALLCTDTTYQTVTVTQPPASGNLISGTIHWNQGLVPDSISSFRVWLIQHNTTANTLTAVDSVNVYPWVGTYTFNNHPSGEYLVKAAPLVSSPASSYGYVPTYHDSSLYWNSASTVTHYSQWTTGKDIWMQLGTMTSGPGFVGGNISQGAGKGTGTGVPGILVFVRNNATNKMIASTYTDDNGDYTFHNLPNGSYNVYPEAMSYNTTPSAMLSIDAGHASGTGVDFVQTPDEIKPKSTLGIAAISKADGINIYPNPVADQLFVENKNGTFTQLTIVNALGQVVKQENIRKGNNTIATSTMGAGIYYVIVKGATGARSVTITKK